MFWAPFWVLAVALGALVLVRTADADPRFDPSFDVSLTNPAPQSPSNVRLSFRLESGPQVAAMVIYLPRDWGIVPGDQIPVGTTVGSIDSTETFGFINSPCNQVLGLRTELLNASLDPSTSVSLRDTDLEQGLDDPTTEGFGIYDFAEDKDKNGLLDVIDHYPDFLVPAFNGERPLTRLAGVDWVAGLPVLRQLLIFSPDTRLSVPDQDASRLIREAGGVWLSGNGSHSGFSESGRWA